MDKDFLTRMKREVEERLTQREAETTEYWLARVTEVAERRQASLASLQVELRNLQEKMRTRLRALKSGG
jgi:DNA-binding CsgD family transcriptional regulator